MGACSAERGAHHSTEGARRAHNHCGFVRDVEKRGRLDVRKCHTGVFGVGMTTSIVATTLPSLRIALASPDAMKQLSSLDSMCVAPWPKSMVTAPSSTT